MRALLDVSVLIALLDADHVFHGKAREWLERDIRLGWASCPITQAGFVRIVTNPNYPSGWTIPSAIDALQIACSTPHHEFWSDDLRLMDPMIDATRIGGSHQITDVYLLALAVKNNGRFVTFDTKINREAVDSSRASNLVVIA